MLNNADFRDEPADIDTDDTNGKEDEVVLPERKQSPFRKKQLDYKHQVRLESSGNRGYRKALKLLPHMERRSFRHALDAATQAARRDEDARLTVKDDLKTLKRSSFTRLVARKTLPLREVLRRKQEHRAERALRNQRRDVEG